ncbi:AAA family ATPase [Nonomuraea sp. NPDC050540]|uniref:helix-turn-helix transcriptional regulator n=1 Tax=Nonomuraea sp. NPDC050540 TaxID=3364367 RepID=UPI0037B92B6A
MLVGREQELGDLLALVSARPAVAMIEGEAGVGKSRLAGELIAQPDLASLRILTGYCQPLREPFPFGPVLEAVDGLRGFTHPFQRARLSPVTGMLRDLLPELSEHLPQSPAPTGDPQAERHRLFRAVREVLGAAGPALLLIEDLHWSDEGTRNLLSFLLSNPPANLAVVLSYRREEVAGGVPLGRAYRPPPRAGSIVVRLRPLTLGHVRTLASCILGGSVPLDFATRLYERTAGLPFVIEETLRAVRSSAGGLPLDGAAARRLLENAEVPVLLREAMAERLASLSGDAIALVRAVAVLGTPATLEHLREVSGLDDQRCRSALGAALDRGVLHEIDGCVYGYRHALARQAVYATMAGYERRRLHLRVIEVLRRLDPPPLVRLADHSSHAGLAEDAQRYGEAAADAAVRVGDIATATHLLQRLLNDPGLPAGDVDRLAIKLGEIAHTGLDQRDPSTTLTRLLDDPRLSAAARGEVRLFLGWMLIRQAEGLDEGRAAIAQAVDELEDRPDLVARGIASLALPYLGTTPLARLHPWTQRLKVALKRVPEGELRMSLLANYLPSLVTVGDPGALRVPDQASGLGAQRHLARLRCNLADSCVCTGRYEQAGHLLRDGLNLAARVGATFVTSTGQATQARLDWMLGRWEGLDERTLRLLEEYRDLLPVASELSLVLGWLATARGEWEQAESWLAGTGIAVPQESIIPVVLSAFAARAKARLARGERELAGTDVERGLHVARTKGVWAWTGELVPVAVDVLMESGRAEQARTLLAELERGLAGRHAPLAAAAVRMAGGQLAEAGGDLAAARAHFEEARRLYEELPAPYYAALAAERLILCGGAVEGLAGLGDVFAALGATYDAERCRHHLRERGVVVRRGRRGYGDTLSPREQDVARLLATGRTNREIAGMLFLSPRTVETHVARILQKLGKHSRTELLQ